MLSRFSKIKNSPACRPWKKISLLRSAPQDPPSPCRQNTARQRQRKPRKRSRHVCGVFHRACGARNLPTLREETTLCSPLQSHEMPQGCCHGKGRGALMDGMAVGVFGTHLSLLPSPALYIAPEPFNCRRLLLKGRCCLEEGCLEERGWCVCKRLALRWGGLSVSGPI